MAQGEASLLIRIKEAGAEALGKVKAGFDEIGKAAGVASAAITAALGLSVKAYSEAEAANNKLNQAIRNQGLDVETLGKRYDELAAAIQEKTTVDGDELKAALASAQALAGSLELTEDLIKATVDYAQATGTDLDSAFEKVGRSIGTTNNALAREGIALDENATKTEKMDAVTKALTQRYDGMAEAQAKGLGSVKQLSNAFGDLAEAVGEQLAPFITKAAKELTGLVKLISENEEVVKYGTAIAAFAAGFTGLVAAIAAVLAAWPALTAAFAVLAGPAGWVIAAAAAVAGLATAWTTNFGGIQDATFAVFSSIKTFWQAFAEDAVRIFGGIKDVVGGAFTLDMDQIEQGIAAITAKSKVSLSDLERSYKETFKARKKAQEDALKKSEAEEKKHAIKVKDFAVEQKRIEASTKAKVDAESRAKRLEEKRAEVEDEVRLTLEREEREALAAEEAERAAAEKSLAIKEELEAEKVAAAERAHQQERAFMDELGKHASTLITTGFQGIAASGVSALTETLLPGFGQAAGQMFNLLSMDSDKFLETVNTLFSTEFLDNIANNIPILFEAFAEALPGLIDKIAERLPEIVTRLIEALIENAPAIAVALATAFTKPEFYIALVNGIANGFANGTRDGLANLADIVTDALKKAWEDVKDMFEIKVPGGGGGSSNPGRVPFRKKPTTSNPLGLNRGGIVPGVQMFAQGGTVDTVPAMLTPGEFVVNARAAARNMGTLQSINNGGGGMATGGTTINLNIYGGMLGDRHDADRLLEAIDKGLWDRRRRNASVAFDTSGF